MVRAAALSFWLRCGLLTSGWTSSRLAMQSSSSSLVKCGCFLPGIGNDGEEGVG